MGSEGSKGTRVPPVPAQSPRGTHLKRLVNNSGVDLIIDMN